MIQFANKLTQSIAFRTFIIVVIVLADRERNRVRHEEHRLIKSLGLASRHEGIAEMHQRPVFAIRLGEWPAGRCFEFLQLLKIDSRSCK